MMCRQVARASDCCLANFDWAVCIALTLYRRTASFAYRARDAGAKHEVVVGRVDDRIDVLLDEISVNDHDSQRRDSSTSATRSSRSLRVALAIPFTPTDPMVIDAHATPHNNASCRASGSPPLSHRAAVTQH